MDIQNLIATYWPLLVVLAAAIGSVISFAIYKKRVLLTDAVPHDLLPPTPEQIDVATVKADRSESQAGYFRFQEDRQPVITRTEDQQKIFDEYFVVPNTRTVTCKSILKKLGLVCQLVGLAGWVATVALAVYLCIANTADLKWCAVTAGVALLVNIAGTVLKKVFIKTIHIDTRPHVLMSHAEFESYVYAKTESLRPEVLSLARLGLSAEEAEGAEPVIIHDQATDDHSLSVIDLAGHALHSSTQHVTYLYATDKQFFVYKLRFDMCCNREDEWSYELFDADISCIESHHIRDILRLTDTDEGIERRTVSFRVTAPSASVDFAMAADNDKLAAVQALLHKIRECKVP